MHRRCRILRCLQCWRCRVLRCRRGRVLRCRRGRVLRCRRGRALQCRRDRVLRCRRDRALQCRRDRALQCRRDRRVRRYRRDWVLRYRLGWVLRAGGTGSCAAISASPAVLAAPARPRPARFDGDCVRRYRRHRWVLPGTAFFQSWPWTFTYPRRYTKEEKLMYIHALISLPGARVVKSFGMRCDVRPVVRARFESRRRRSHLAPTRNGVRVCDGGCTEVR